MSGAPRFLDLLGAKRTWSFDQYPTLGGLLADTVRAANLIAAAFERQGPDVTVTLSPEQTRTLLTLLHVTGVALDYLVEGATVEVRQRCDRRLKEGLEQVKEG